MPAPPLYRRHWFVVTAAVALILLVWLALAANRLLSARDLALDGVSRLESIRAEVTVDAVTDGDLTRQLEEAAAVFSSAHDRTRSPLVTPLRLVPWVGTQIRSADALSNSAGQVTNALADAAAEVADLSGLAADTDRVTVASRALAITRTARGVLTEVDLGPSEGLIGSLADARERFSTELGEADGLLADLETASTGVAEFLEGPSTYLLLAANNSEMQAGSGSYLMAGTVRVANGKLEIGEIRNTSELILESGSVEIPDGDLADRWGWLDLSSDWRNLSPTPRFAPNAQLAAAMWQELENEAIDGVIVLDPIGLSAIMAATGPVEVDGRSINADGVVRELLFDQYWEDDVEVRRDRLKEIATAALRAVDESATDLITLAKGLQDAAAGRHILAWSLHSEQQAAWQVIGIDGALDEDSLSVAVINRGANKLDSFLNLDAHVTVAEAGDDRTVRLSLTLHNQAQAAFPQYVLGPAAGLGNEPGTYVGVLAVNIPGFASQAAFRDVESLVAAGVDGVSQVIAVWVEIPPGAILNHELMFQLPGELTSMRIEPSARVPGIEWSAGGRQWLDAAAAVLDLTTDTVTGAAFERQVQRVVFEPDPLANPVAPIPFMRVDGDVETTVIVNWQELDGDPGIDVWERPDGGEWTVVGTDFSRTPLTLTDRIRTQEYCYRTALHRAPDSFSATECITVPAALGFVRFGSSPDDYFSSDDFIGRGDLDVRVLVAPDDWGPDFWQMFAGQYDSPNADRSWRFGIDVFTALVGNFSGDGLEDLGANRGLTPSFRDGRRKWVRMTVEPSRGILRFWTSNGGTVWTQLGDDRTFSPIDALNDSRGRVYVGTDRPGSDNPFAGKLYYVEIRDGVGGPVIANLDFRTPDQLNPASGEWTDDHGNTFRPHGSGWEYVSVGD